ncbi:MAG: EAL domain-containing protein [Candidatus Parcubacteria bacterium]|nr:EAL domain-containing protein [Burkholderiales bacterium]
MSESEKAGETTQFLQRMDGQLLGWDQPAARLREALDYDHFRLYAQPVVSLGPDEAAPGGIAMAEVLVRLREEEAQMLPPGDFLPAFEHYRMMAELDRWVVRTALRKLGGGGKVARLSVNVSAQTLEEPGFAPFVAVQLRLASLDPAALVIEIDENDALDRREAAERFAIEMKGIGCQLLLDGFARRSVSFEPLKALLVDFVKVDGTISRNILRSAGAVTKMKAILRVGQGTGVKVIAECVEDDKVLAALRMLKVDYAQGFGVRKPEPIEDLFKS